MFTSPKRIPRHGFTLVEILVVITIIGVLAGLLLPAVMNAMNTAQQTAYKLEVDALADAVEKYRNKYGDYPPDGSSWQIMERHLRKAFPQIIASELNLLDPAQIASQGWSGNPWNVNTSNSIVAGVRNDFDQNVTTGNGFGANDLKVMDPAEALVFFLGGFSADPQRPFTGNGGPFIATGLAAGQTLQYNVARSNSMFEFKTNRLTLIQAPAGTTLVNVSNDEDYYLNNVSARDLLPVYLSRADISRSAPFVYFDSRTYVFNKGTVSNSNNTNLPYRNFYQRSSTTAALTASEVKIGAIRPLVSNTRRTPAIAPVTPLDWYRTNLFMEDKKFQVIGPGLDDSYGGLMAQDVDISSVSLSDRLAAYWTFPSGNSYMPGSAPTATIVCTRLLLPINQKGQPGYERSRGIADNCANCTERTFITSLSTP